MYNKAEEEDRMRGFLKLVSLMATLGIVLSLGIQQGAQVGVVAQQELTDQQIWMSIDSLIKRLPPERREEISNLLVQYRTKANLASALNETNIKLLELSRGAIKAESWSKAALHVAATSLGAALVGAAVKLVEPLIKTSAMEYILHIEGEAVAQLYEQLGLHHLEEALTMEIGPWKAKADHEYIKEMIEQNLNAATLLWEQARGLQREIVEKTKYYLSLIPPSAPPIILGILFPEKIIGDKRKNWGVVYFMDPNGDINHAYFRAVGGTGRWSPFDFDPRVKGQTEGSFDFYIWCETDRRVTALFEVVLTDEGGNRSAPESFEFTCVPP
jgi:hypothetical protein